MQQMDFVPFQYADFESQCLLTTPSTSMCFCLSLSAPLRLPLPSLSLSLCTSLSLYLSFAASFSHVGQLHSSQSSISCAGPVRAFKNFLSKKFGKMEDWFTVAPAFREFGLVKHEPHSLVWRLPALGSQVSGALYIRAVVGHCQLSLDKTALLPLRVASARLLQQCLQDAFKVLDASNDKQLDSQEFEPGLQSERLGYQRRASESAGWLF